MATSLTLSEADSVSLVENPEMSDDNRTNSEITASSTSSETDNSSTVENLEILDGNRASFEDVARMKSIEDIDASDYKKKKDVYMGVFIGHNWDEKTLVYSYFSKKFSGVRPILKADAKEDYTVTIQIETTYKEGDIKLVLIDAEDKVTDITNATQIHLFAGENVISISGYNAAGDLKITLGESDAITQWSDEM